MKKFNMHAYKQNQMDRTLRIGCWTIILLNGIDLCCAGIMLHSAFVLNFSHIILVILHVLCNTRICTCTYNYVTTDFVFIA